MVRNYSHFFLIEEPFLWKTPTYAGCEEEKQGRVRNSAKGQLRSFPRGVGARFDSLK